MCMEPNRNWMDSAQQIALGHVWHREQVPPSLRWCHSNPFCRSFFKACFLLGMEAAALLNTISKRCMNTVFVHVSAGWVTARVLILAEHFNATLHSSALIYSKCGALSPPLSHFSPSILPSLKKASPLNGTWEEISRGQDWEEVTGLTQWGLKGGRHFESWLSFKWTVLVSSSCITKYWRKPWKWSERRENWQYSGLNPVSVAVSYLKGFLNTLCSSPDSWPLAFDV